MTGKINPSVTAKARRMSFGNGHSRSIAKRTGKICL